MLYTLQKTKCPSVKNFSCCIDSLEHTPIQRPCINWMRWFHRVSYCALVKPRIKLSIILLTIYDVLLPMVIPYIIVIGHLAVYTSIRSFACTAQSLLCPLTCSLCLRSPLHSFVCFTGKRFVCELNTSHYRCRIKECLIPNLKILFLELLV